MAERSDVLVNLQLHSSHKKLFLFAYEHSQTWSVILQMETA